MDRSVYETPRQHIDLSGLSLSGRVLDVGGGGEGIIARRLGARVTVVDIRPEELAEAPDIGLKVVMDARNLQFLSDYWDHVTCFYALMYMETETIVRFLGEAYRVLKPGGSLWIWDAHIPAGQKAGVYVAQLAVKISAGETVNTGYGVGWERVHTLETAMAQCRQAGFRVQSEEARGESFTLRCTK